MDYKIIDRLLQRSYIFYYSCKGYREKEKWETNVKNPHPQTKFSGMIWIKINSCSTGKFVHSDKTTTPGKSHLLGSQRKITLS